MHVFSRISAIAAIAIVVMASGYVLLHNRAVTRNTGTQNTEGYADISGSDADSKTTNRYGKIVFNGSEYDYEKGGGDLAVQMNAKKTNDVSLATHKPTDVFLEVNDEKVTWGEFDDFLPVLDVIAPVSLPQEASPDEVMQIIEKTHNAYAAKYCNVYLRHALLAQKARNLGISVSQEEILKALSNSVEKISRPKLAKIRKRIFTPKSFSWREQENFLLTKKYREEVLSKQISVTAEEIELARKNRLAEIDAAAATNRTLRPKLEGLLSDIRSGKRTFEQTAEEFSDCPSSDEGGVLGEFEPDCDLLPPLKNYAFSAPTNVLSDVIETPYSYHIVKVLERKFEEEDDKNPSSVVVAHIMLEKEKVDDPLDDEGAREFVWRKKLQNLTTVSQKAALKEAKVKSAFQITLFSKKTFFAK